MVVLQAVVLPYFGPHRSRQGRGRDDAVRRLRFFANELFAGTGECSDRRSQDLPFEPFIFCQLGVAPLGSDPGYRDRSARAM